MALLWFGWIGLVDDLAKWRARSGNRGMSEAKKLMLQGAFAAAFVGLLASPWSPLAAREAAHLDVPFVKTAGQLVPPLPAAGVLFVMLVGNAVNITDGLDGLAIVPSVFVVGVLGFFATSWGTPSARYLFSPLLPVPPAGLLPRRVSRRGHRLGLRTTGRDSSSATPATLAISRSCIANRSG